MFSFLNFNDIGATTSNKTAAFKKIRANSKVYNTNLVHTPTNFVNRYNSINKMLVNETKFLEATNYGLKRQHNLTANAATNCNNLNFLDKASFNQFLDHSCKYSLSRPQTAFFTENLHGVAKKLDGSLSSNTALTPRVLNSPLLVQPNSLSTLERVNFNQVDSDTQFN
jgi:hypothetical protein